MPHLHPRRFGNCQRSAGGSTHKDNGDKIPKDRRPKARWERAFRLLNLELWREMDKEIITKSYQRKQVWTSGPAGATSDSVENARNNSYSDVPIRLASTIYAGMLLH